MFMNAQIIFTKFPQKVTSRFCPSILGPPSHNNIWLSIRGEYLVLWSNTSRKVPPFQHNV
jgi:hypothetical protein